MNDTEQIDEVLNILKVNDLPFRGLSVSLDRRDTSLYIQQLADKYREFEAEIETYASKDGDIEDFESEIADLKDDISGLQGEIEDFETEIKILKNDKDVLETEVGELRDEIAILNHDKRVRGRT